MRPRKELTDEHIRQLELLAGYGLTLPQIGAVIGISERELRTRKNQTAVNAALESGKAKAQAQIGKALFLRAKEGDVSAIRWWEMTRAKRRPMQPEGENGSSDSTVTIRVVRSAPDQSGPGDG